jgi:hypothetical protein
MNVRFQVGMTDGAEKIYLFALLDGKSGVDMTGIIPNTGTEHDQPSFFLFVADRKNDVLTYPEMSHTKGA